MSSRDTRFPGLATRQPCPDAHVTVTGNDVRRGRPSGYFGGLREALERLAPHAAVYLAWKSLNPLNGLNIASLPPPHRKEKINKTLHSPLSSYWIVVREEGFPQVGLLNSSLFDRQKLLPVFGSRQEAELFLQLRMPEGWRVKDTSASELILLLYGPCADVGRIALDPVPEIDSCWIGADLVSMDRKSFIELLVGKILGSAKGTDAILQGTEIS